MRPCHKPNRSRPAARTVALVCAGVSVVQASACSGEGWLGGREPTVRDSAGVTVVVHPARAPRPLDLDGEPDVVIGDRGAAPDALAQVGPIQPLPNGNVVVAELASAQLRFFDGDGEHLRTVQGRRSGPAAFGAPLSSWLWGDTLFVTDRRLQRLLSFDTAGTFLRGRSLSPEFAADRPVEGAVCAPPQLLGGLPDGSRVVWGWNCVTPDASRSLLPSRATLRVMGSFRRDSVGTFLTSRVWTPTESPDSWVVPPFAPRVSGAVGDGYIYLSRGETYAIEVYDVSGRLVRIMSEEGEPPVVTQESRDAFSREAEIGYPDDVVFPERLPAYAQLLLSESGEVWALKFPPPDEDRQVWTVYSPDGLERRRVELPDLDWRAVGYGRVWGVRPVERRVHQVVAFDLGG